MPSISSFPLFFLKLGGSLITDKTHPHTARLDVLARLADEIATALDRQPGLRLVLGHGSGSFGHVPARRYGTREGVRTREQWLGFLEVWREAAFLNRLVMDILAKAGLPAIAFQPSSAVTAHDGQVQNWELTPLQSALEASLLPVVYGDVVFDISRGGSILSTEDLFTHLARNLQPKRMLLAGREAGVWADYPACTRLVTQITPESLPQIAPALGGSASTDVTGGMASKVRETLALAGEIPGLEVFIFSGGIEGMVTSALMGERLGTCVFVPQ